MILIGNKVDLKRDVTTEEGQNLANKYNIPFYETSAKESINILESVRCLLTNIIEEESKENEQKKPTRESFVLQQKKKKDDSNSTSKSSCC